MVVEVVENETGETETKRKSCNIIIHGVGKLMNADQKELENDRDQYDSIELEYSHMRT